MLIHLHIENFALIDTLDLNFDAGMTAFTGETGAGKSIIIDALTILLGGRFENHLLKKDSSKCDLTASFDLSNKIRVIQWLKEHELWQNNNECIVRRIINTENRSKSSINSYPVPLPLVKELSNLLLTIHGQQDHHGLLQPEIQRNTLDHMTKKSLATKVREDYLTWRMVDKTLQVKLIQHRDLQAQQELLQFQLDELNKLDLLKNELAELDKEQRRLSKTHELLKSTELALHLLQGDEGSCLHSMAQALHALQIFLELDDRLVNATDLLNSALIHTQEAANELQHFLSTTELNPQRLQLVEERLTVIHDLARKHHINPNELLDFHKSLKEKMQTLSSTTEEIAALQQELDAKLALYYQNAKKLSQQRQVTAKKLSTEVTEYMQKLGMKNGFFEVKLERLTDAKPTPFGCERVEFLVCTNPGNAVLPLAKIASGGELSRLCLALNVITSNQESTSTLIFDEIDVGIGGATAAIVGQLLRKLSKTTQIFCITHSPQVAAQSEHHFLVKKTSNNQKTLVLAEGLNKPEKINELARMLGGTKITKNTLAHAKEMLELTDDL